MRKNLRIQLCFMILLLFWGMLYPQYALTKDMYRVTDGYGRVLEKDPVSDYARISAAGPGEVELHFSLLEKLDAWFGEKKTYEDRGN